MLLLCQVALMVLHRAHEGVVASLPALQLHMMVEVMMMLLLTMMMLLMILQWMLMVAVVPRCRQRPQPPQWWRPYTALHQCDPRRLVGVDTTLCLAAAAAGQPAAWRAACPAEQSGPACSQQGERGQCCVCCCCHDCLVRQRRQWWQLQQPGHGVVALGLARQTLHPLAGAARAADLCVDEAQVHQGC